MKVEKTIQAYKKQELPKEFEKQYTEALDSYRMNINKTPTDQLAYVFNSKKRTQLARYFSQQQNRYTHKIKSNSNDTDLGLLDTDPNKLRLMDELHKVLNVKWWNVDFERDCDVENPKVDISDKLLREIELSFRINKKGGIPTTYNELYKQLLDLYNHMWKDITEAPKNGTYVKKIKKKFSFNIINKENL